ncbi:toprim domain-containing protein [Nocardioides eburneiflavus]|uniref:Toprim domain-containing protein n=1 Tax=Nocardioides eburneiflavus TaxID=2518372 RepID=A0A4Z1C438_9ACTN|nr:MobF family relaxase [Nocardioides eburneiflavus]TGN65044.1 toprim domain-containing protein [Nocardioides eburneiflavus]
MSLHKLTAGSGYDYLTRQVAAMDATDKGHTGLASYYTEKGETPGVWIGSGMVGIDGLDAGDVVTADHMQSLFGSGHHPLATQRTKQLDLRIGRDGAQRPTEADYKAAVRLGIPYKIYDNDISPFRIAVAKRFSEWNEAAGHPGDYPVPAAERARIRTEVGREFFRAEHGREPADARELAATIAKHSRSKTNAVAGYDLTLSPVKSVSTLWAIADPKTAAVIERAHQTAIKDALDFIESKALFTRRGTNGVRQVEVRGLVATAFTHRDSRAGDPDLHTHVAVANKVQTLDGTWLAIDGRPLHKAVVSASETYNTALERHLIDALGVRFEERPNEDARKRPVREIVGVDPDLNRRFSKRRINVEDRRKVLAAAFQATHGRPPTPVETIQLSQQATLETREAKHEPRSLAEQREAWNREAVEVLGTPQRVKQMVHGVLNPKGAARSLADLVVNAAWFTQTTDRIVATMEGSRSTWQYWHVYAEAQRQVRAANVPTNQVSQVVDLLVSEVLDGRSVSMARPWDPISEPVELRRADGSSVYTQARAELFTSSKVLAAEQRLVDAAGRHDGYAVEASSVDLALLESTANGITLNAGQATLVREMATSGARLQLAIAPAGSGKTTAMRVLASAWSDGGGTVIGLAPSAAAADALRTSMGSQIDTQTDTLAKLTHSLEQARQTGAAMPDWVAGIDSSTLVVIDEAGMADTLSLDAAVSYILERGGSVRLIGDDQQLSAIGAGGVLRDIRATHGALQLTELVRFKDPAEGAASLALREGKSEALGFYLDRDRVHVGDLATMTEEVFAAWQADRAAGLDSIMLAPTRDLVSELNQQARAHRLEGIDPNGPNNRASGGPVRRLADGNEASIGELIITRENDRRLRTSATDWVKNGDRWTVLEIHDVGDLTVQHTQHGRTVRLPSNYVAKATELGYACTVHTAQGVTADTMHGLATGTESRQQLYTMMTRGAHANHVYLEVVGDGDPHSVIHPTLVRPLTPTDILESMLARDDAQRSATSLVREQADPATRLGEASQRYLDSLYVAAEDLLRHETTTGVDGTTVNVVDALDTAVESLAPGLSDEAAWPSLRAHLLLLGAAGENPVEALRAAAGDRELESARDRAAVLDWRLDASGLRNAGAGPLPWMPGIPNRLAEDPHWGAYLSQRAHLVEQLAGQVHTRAAEQSSLPVWAQNGIRPEAATVADVEVWRAAMQVPVDDRRPTGAPQLQKASATWQRRLNRAVTGDHTPALKEWRQLLSSLAPQVSADEFTPLLAERLAAMSRAGVTAHELLRTAAAPDHPAGPLPDEHAPAALWWRLARHLTPAVAAQIGDGSHGESVTTDWAPRLADLFGPERAASIQASTWWPALVSNVDHGLQRGWQVEALLGAGRALPSDGWEGVDECQALVWRTSIALETAPDEHAHEYHFEEPPADLWEGIEPDQGMFVDQPDDIPWPLAEDPGTDLEPPVDLVDEHQVDALEEDLVDALEEDLVDVDEDQYIESDLTLAAYIRDLGGTRLEPTDADIRLMYQRADEWHSSPVTRERMVEVNELTQTFFESRFTDSWGRDYLTGRFGVDLAGDERFRPGQAPAGWTNLVDHLRGRGISDAEMLATGVATEASTGRLIDRFRDRVMFPVIHQGEVLGFVGRRRPDLTDDDKAGPKYLNTANTPLFHKGAQLFGVADELLAEGAVPVIAEGPMDAIAVTIASAGLYLGVATLGTSLTDEQAAQLAAVGRDPIVATDADLAGQVAAERDFWMLTSHGLDPGYTRFPDGLDPADLLAQRGPAALTAAVASGQPAFRSLGDQLLTERLDNLPAEQARLAAMRVISARPSRAWEPGVNQVRARLQLSHLQARRDLRDAVKTWDADPRKAAVAELHKSSEVRARLAAAADKTPAERWAPLARELDPRLLDQGDWPATAAMLQRAHEHGHDVGASTRAIVSETPLGDSPARDLRYRIVSRLGMPIDATSPLDIPAIRQSQGAHHPWSSPTMDRRMPPPGRR